MTLPSLADDSPRKRLIVACHQNRVLAHRVLFKHRHPQESPEFHDEMIRRWHGRSRYELMMAFRGGAKSTIGEEALPIMAGFREFKNCIILGYNADRAIERLAAIKHEIESNDAFRQVFGDLRGPVWGDDRVVLANNVMIQAHGRGQALRGIKHQDMRPDMVFFDDLEERGDVTEPAARAKLLRWFMTSVIPAMDPGHRGRMAATPLDPEALPMSLARDPEWNVSRFPIKYKDSEGKWKATWPARFPLTRAEAVEIGAEDSVEAIENRFVSQGMLQDFNSEYMCEAETPELKPFKQEMFRTEPQVRTWQAVYAMFDPARTTNKDSATTGFAAWTWMGPRLVVWQSWGKLLMPDQILDALFEVNEQFHPTLIGVEEDGLNEWLLQPIRQMQAAKGITLPLKAERAPRGKLDFIRALQPYFNAREVVFAEPMQELERQLKSFPTGRIDAPNALAYALKMRPGAPIFDSFSNRHIAENLQPLAGQPAWLAINAKGGTTAAAVVQLIDGAIRVYADCLREGEPALTVPDIVAWANLEVSRNCRVVIPPHHWEKYTNIGLVQALKKCVGDVRQGAPLALGREWLRHQLQREVRGQPAVVVSDRARWVLNGFAGGYSRELMKGGGLSETAEENQYKVLFEAVESFAGLLKVGSLDRDNDERQYATAADGRRYVSALPVNRR
jgi:hypothetical protein